MVQLHRNPPVTDRLRAQVVDCWVAVTNAGGAVGFVAPVTAEQVRPTAEAELDRCADGTNDLVIACEDERLVGLGFLVTNTGQVVRHWATVQRLQRDPRWRGAGVGARILAELEDAAGARGLRKVYLTTRGSLPVHHFYLGQGYTWEATLPDKLLVDGELVAEHVLAKRLDGSSPADPAGTILEVVRLDPELPLPAYAHPGDAGLDLRTRVDVRLEPGERALVPTGVAVAVPTGHVGLVHPRSGLAVRHGLGMVNSPGTIDAGYRGEVAVPLINLDRATPILLRRGDRIAQLVVQTVAAVVPTEVASLEASARAAGGFGSTGR